MAKVKLGALLNLLVLQFITLPVKQPFASENPEIQAEVKLGSINVFLNTIFSLYCILNV